MYLILISLSCNSFVQKGILENGEYSDDEKFISSSHLTRSYTISLEDSKYFIVARSNETGEFREYMVEHGMTELTKDKLYLKPKGILCDEIVLDEDKVIYLDYRKVDLSDRLMYVENLEENIGGQNRSELFKTNVLNVVKLNGTIMLKDSLFWKTYRMK